MGLLLWLTSPGCNKKNNGLNDAGQFDPWECLLNSEAPCSMYNSVADILFLELHRSKSQFEDGLAPHLLL